MSHYGLLANIFVGVVQDDSLQITVWLTLTYGLLEVERLNKPYDGVKR